MRLPLLLLVPLLLAQPRARACTIFVLTDAERTLFFNNEDWSDPNAQLWFVPAGRDHLGCAYVGFEDGWAQGGVNTAGLAFDWVAHPEVAYTPDPVLTQVRGNSAQRMLEVCTTVDEAIAFYRAHREVEFARGRILIADRTGASVIIGVHDGALRFARDDRSRGFGYGAEVLQRRIADSPEATLAHGAAILRACAQSGDTPTQYANVFDLRRGEITLYPTPARDDAVRFDLAAELEHGGRAYAIRDLAAAPTAGARPLSPAQQRFYLDTFTELPDVTAAVGPRLIRVLTDAAAGGMREADYTPALWSELAPVQTELRGQLAPLGPLSGLTVVAHATQHGSHVYRCLVRFTKARVLQRYTLDADGLIAAVATEFVELERP